MSLTERGQREVVGGLREALERLRRRKADLQRRLGLLEAELSDAGKIEAALLAAAEIVGKPP